MRSHLYWGETLKPPVAQTVSYLSAIIRGFIVRFLHQMQLCQNSCHSKSIFDRIVEVFHFLFECSITPPTHRMCGGYVERRSAAQHMILIHLGLQRILRDPRNNKNNLVYWILGIRLMNESWHRMFLAVGGLAVERLLEKGVARLTRSSWPSLRCLLLLLLLLQHRLLLLGCCL